MKLMNPCTHSDPEGACAELPELKRLNYFHGQMLGVNDFRTEQAFFREKLKLHNRCLHGWGTVCGLMVSSVPPPRDCLPASDGERAAIESKLRELRAELQRAREAKDESAAERVRQQMEKVQAELDRLPPASCDDAPPARILVDCGLALDCHGNEIIVPRPYAFDPWLLLSDEDRKRVSAGAGEDVYLSICYCELPVDPMRPVLPDACGAMPECTHGKVRDAFRLRASVEPPAPDTRCETCCSACQDDCVLLAVLRGWRRGEAPASVDNSVRRLVSTYPATTITGISFRQGATYSVADAADILGAKDGPPGIQVNLSRRVLTSTLVRGVVQLWVIEGGATRRAGMYCLEGDFESFGGAPAVDSFRYTYQGDEGLDSGDQLLLQIRCAFILDECCQPVDGAHVGGRVPVIPAFSRFDRPAATAECGLKPPGYGPWTSGCGTPGSTFEAWFFVEPRTEKGKRANLQEQRS